MFVMAAARSSPMLNADGSLNRGPEEVVEAGAGDGVAGGAAAAVLDEAGAAGGAAGVAAGCGAGVAGSAGFAGAGLGYMM